MGCGVSQAAYKQQTQSPISPTKNTTATTTTTSPSDNLPHENEISTLKAADKVVVQPSADQLCATKSPSLNNVPPHDTETILKNESNVADQTSSNKLYATTTSAPRNSLPHDYETILMDADSVITKPSIDQLYAGVFLNNKKKKYWVDKVSGGNCFLVYARDLSITWGNDRSYWQWLHIKETSDVFIDIAKLRMVCWLQVIGKIELAKLTPGLKYEAVYVVMMEDGAYGWQFPITMRLELPDGDKQEHKEKLLKKTRSKWFEIQVGEFIVNANKNEGFIKFSLLELEFDNWKSGLLIRGVVIRPKN
uniref:lectin-like n=1 Tax=Erigeron canadensis TaxID=72917 RepID=UPI001CB94076|nr:lectin-like [Erigeron canadensis]